MNATLQSPGQRRRLAPYVTLLAASLLASWTPLDAQQNRALFLDGVGDYMTVPSAPALQNRTAITIEAWINPVLTSGNQYCTILNKGGGQTALSQRTYELRWFPKKPVQDLEVMTIGDRLILLFLWETLMPPGILAIQPKRADFLRQRDDGLWDRWQVQMQVCQASRVT